METLDLPPITPAILRALRAAYPWLVDLDHLANDAEIPLYQVRHVVTRLVEEGLAVCNATHALLTIPGLDRVDQLLRSWIR